MRVCAQNKARTKLYGKKGSVASTKNESNSNSKQIYTDEYYASLLGFRSLPAASFLKAVQPIWVLPISSINEDKLLRALGLSDEERTQIEGLASRH
eukprot:2691243-Prymnesium_polylepis.2